MKILNSVKRYFEYRKNRRYVKMEMLKYKVVALQFLNGVLENMTDENKGANLGENIKEILDTLNQLGNMKKQEKNNGISK